MVARLPRSSTLRACAGCGWGCLPELVAYSSRVPPAPRPLLLHAFAIVLAGLGLAACANAQATPAPDGIRTVDLVGSDGQSATLDQFIGEPLILNFFASWCAPCKAELPAFEAVQQDLGSSIQIIGVSLDLTEEDWLGLVSDTGLTYTTLYDPGQELFEAFDGTLMPMTVVIDEDGDVIQSHLGALASKISPS